MRRQALRYIIRNTTFPQRVRAQAQLQLSQMHCYTRFTQVKNRCIMGGKGRGVFSDFRLGRVCTMYAHSSTGTDTAAVPIPHQRARRKPARRKEGELVKRRQDDGIWGTCVYYCKDTHWHWAALSCGLYNEMIISPSAPKMAFLIRRSFLVSLLSPLTVTPNAATRPRKQISLRQAYFAASVLLPRTPQAHQSDNSSYRVRHIPKLKQATTRGL